MQQLTSADDGGRVANGHPQPGRLAICSLRWPAARKKAGCSVAHE